MENASIEQIDTLTIVDDGATIQEKFVSGGSDLMSQLRETVAPTKTSDILDFMRRPVILYQGTWTNAQAQGAVLWRANFPEALLATTIPQNYFKVLGHMGMTARVRIRIQVNSQPFQAGLAALCYIPYGDYMPSHTNWFLQSQPTSAPVNADLFAVSQLPHQLLNLANCTSVEFVSPYLSPYLMANVATGQGSFGTFAFVNFRSVMSASGSESVPYTIWASFEDVKLYYPTDAPVTTIWAQAGSELQNMHRTGTISGAANDVGMSIARFLPTVGLGGLKKPVEVFSTVGAGLLRMFGLAKPTIQAPVTRTIRAPLRYFQNIDGSDTGHKLALSAGNELEMMPGFAGTDADEMDLSYVASRQALVGSGLWGTGNGADTVLWSSVLTPRVLGSLSQWSGNKAFPDNLSPAGYLANFFEMWRGDFVFTFHLVKTQMHSGRLRASIRLGNFQNASSVLNDMPGYTHTVDVDLTTACEFTVRVPYSAVRPWMYTDADRSIPFTSGDAFNHSLGTIQLAIVNPLCAPPSANTFVPIFVFAHMENAAFAVSSFSNIVPYGIPQTYPAGAVAQAGGMIEPTKLNTEYNKQYPTDLLPYRSCVGETITNFRQLLKRFEPIWSRKVLTPVPATGTAPGSSGMAIFIKPWAPIAPLTHSTITTTSPDYRRTDLYSILYSMYAFYRGSMRFKLVLDHVPTGQVLRRDIPFRVYINNATVPGLTQALTGVPSTADGTLAPVQRLYDVPSTNPGSLGPDYEFMSTGLPIFMDAEHVIEFDVPYYSTGHMCPTIYTGHDQTARRTNRCPIPQVVVVHPDLPGCTVSVYRAAGDDFSFGGLLGTMNTLWFKYNQNPVGS